MLAHSEGAEETSRHSTYTRQLVPVRLKGMLMRATWMQTVH